MKFIGNVLAGVSSIVYFLFLLVMTGVLVFSNVFSAEYYTKVLEDVDFKEIKLSDLGVTDLEKDMTVEEVLVDALGEVGISNSDAEKIINNEKINEVAGELISETVTYYALQEEVPQLDVQDVKEILGSEEMSVIVDEIPSNMSAEEITDEINKMIRESLEGGSYVE